MSRNRVGASSEGRVKDTPVYGYGDGVSLCFIGSTLDIADNDLDASGDSTRLSPALSKMEEGMGRRKDKSE